MISLAQMVEDMPKFFPKLDVTPSGLDQLKSVVDLLTTNESIQKGENLAKDIERQLIEKLTYLNDYGGERFRVRLSKDFGLLCFSLTWRIKDEAGFRHFCDGGLQFDGARQPYSSVNIAPTGEWWSIHT